MKNEIQIVIKGKKYSDILYVNKNITVEEILNHSNYPDKKKIIAALVNNVYHDLSEEILYDSQIEFISIKSNKGLRIYRSTAVFILSYVIKKIYSKNILNIGPSIQFNFYFDLQDKKKINNQMLLRLRKEFDNTVNANLKIEKLILTKKEAVNYYRKMKEQDKTYLAEDLNWDNIRFYKLNNFQDVCAGPIAPYTGMIKKYKFIPYPPGFLLVFPKIIKSRFKILKSVTPKKLSKVFLETRDWYETQEVYNVTKLNKLIKQKKLSDIINVSEAFHEKRISIIADEISKRKNDIKFILIAGPSSSGKTTFAKRLSIQLRVNSIKPISISIDNYFVNREKTPRDENGNFDFECLEALDLNLFNQHLSDLLKGKTIQMPLFDFHKGHRRKDKTIPMKLDEDQIVLIEGIHGLNEKLTYSVPKNKKFKIYVSALSQLRISNNFRIPTRDTRLFRRIVRDYTYRNHSAYETLKMWRSVRRGEEKNIFPFQEDADIIFNSGLIFETAILKKKAYKYLKMVSHNVPEYAEAKRLIHILDFFLEGDDKYVPKVSILREFVGGSAFKY